MTGKPNATAFELDRDNVAFASIMGAPGFFIDIDANDLDAMNHHRDRSRLINFSRLRRAQTGSQVERQPLQAGFLGRRKTHSGFRHAHLRIQLAGLYTCVKIAVKVG